MNNKAIFVQAGGGYDKVVIGKSDAAAPKAGEITVRMRANSLNYHDFAVISGLMGPSELRIPMADGAGEVIAVGEGVGEFVVGDAVVSTFFPDWLDGKPGAVGFSRVPGDGLDGYARETVTASATSFTRAPTGWSHAEAATLPTAGLVAWRALVDVGQVKAGDFVLVQGTGGVSIFALQFAKMLGATVIATSSNDAKLEHLRALGADHLINYRQDSNWGETALRLTEGRGVNLVIEVGGPSTLQQSMAAACVGGHIAIIGILSGVSVELPVLDALVKQLHLQAVLVGSRRQQMDMVRAIEANSMRPVIDKHFPLEKMVEAFRYQESNQHFGKIVLDI
ncbi:NAD(P)-dependent alcohol dehydrogenase [Pseudomonas sp. PCH199]|uniref:zinc-dependent alcohol dehydrogenase family protein n=1 Tax=unclassified Pseudomonas TaxID=196821 RepID=UPI000BCEBF74|nr:MULTISPECIES: NAD(P)-dependent alcohol dehydrogenase [unclassified Pseudomonas]MCW8277239.1 NAD(P)-dependent alcohol dehydrogenase [Pseudomonas sp. PCH199]PAM82571.1 alcohol dehydrogenase [Pseudomonas sp. ERMR1:02]